MFLGEIQGCRYYYVLQARVQNTKLYLSIDNLDSNTVRKFLFAENSIVNRLIFGLIFGFVYKICEQGFVYKKKI